MATEADVDKLIVECPQESVFVWRSDNGIDDARSRAAVVARTDIEFYPPRILRDVPAFIEDRDGRPIHSVVVDPLLVLTTRKNQGLEELMGYVTPAAVIDGES